MKQLGSVWEQYFPNSEKPKLNTMIDADKVSNLPTNKHGEIKVAFVKNPNKTSDKHPDLIIVDNSKGDVKNAVLYANFNKESLQKETPNPDGKIWQEGMAKKEKSIGADRSDYYFASGPKNDRKYNGRGWTPQQMQGERIYIGNAWKKDFEDGGKTYNLSLKHEEISKMNTNEYGDVRLSIAPRKEPGKGGTHSVYISKGPESSAEATFSLKKEELMKSEVNEHGYVKGKTIDKKEIGKDRADMIVIVDRGKDKPKDEKDKVVGIGYSHKQENIRLRKEDLSPEGLSKAIAVRHPLKVAAILEEKPGVIRKKHLTEFEKIKGDNDSDKKIADNLQTAYAQKNAQKTSVKV